MARPFMASVISTRTKPAAAAFTWKAASGREVQLNIWIGITVNGENSHSKDTNGGSAFSGAGGRKAMKVSARSPYTIDGTPGRLVMLISVRSVTECLRAYSSR